MGIDYYSTGQVMLMTRKEILNAQDAHRNQVSFAILIPIRVWNPPPWWKLAHNEYPLLTLGAM